MIEINEIETGSIWKRSRDIVRIESIDRRSDVATIRRQCGGLSTLALRTLATLYGESLDPADAAAFDNPDPDPPAITPIPTLAIADPMPSRWANRGRRLNGADLKARKAA